jgi:hypothetical protein
MNCRCCCKRIPLKTVNTPVDRVLGVYRCPHCEAIQGQCYLGESYGLVKPYLDPDPNVDPLTVRYYDFTTLGSQGIGRRHGWYNPATRLIVQTG